MRSWVTSLLICCALGVPAAEGTDSLRTIQRDSVLGTQATLQVLCEDPTAAAAVAESVWSEVQRWEAVASTWSPDSELSRLLQAGSDGTPQRASLDLLKLLQEVGQWRERTGVVQPRIALALRRWRHAAEQGAPPLAADLAALQAEVQRDPWQLDLLRLTVAFPPPVAVDIDAVAKGAIIDRVLNMVAARPETLGAALNIGGDLRCWGARTDFGDTTWPVVVADPGAPGGDPLARLLIRGGQAVATSGSSGRDLLVGDQRYSHLIDPRSARPVAGLSSATVIASSAAAADAWASAVMLLGPIDGLAAIEEDPGLEALLVLSDGSQRASSGWADYLDPAFLPEVPDAGLGDGPPWPADHRVAIDLRLSMRTPKAYLAAWIETEGGSLVRLLTLWGDDGYAHTMRRWQRHARKHSERADLLTEPTRRPGRHRLTWDGRDDQGQAVPQGRYRICVEVNREHGERHYLQELLDCGMEPDEHRFEANSNLDHLELRYGPATRP